MQAGGVVVVGEGARQQELDRLLTFEVSLGHIAQRLEAAHRIELHTARVGESGVLAGAEVTALAQRDGAFQA